MTSTSIHREFDVDLAGAEALEAWLDAATEDWPHAGLVMKARVCVSEIASNLMEHGGEPGRAPRLSVRLAMDADGLILDLVDDGRAFDPTAPTPSREPETLETATPGGRGLRTIRGLARTMEYRREGGRNRLRLGFGPAA